MKTPWRNLCTVLLLLCAACTAPGSDQVGPTHTAPTSSVATPLPIALTAATPTSVPTALPTPFDIDVDLTLLPGSPPLAFADPYILHVLDGRLTVAGPTDTMSTGWTWQSMVLGQDVVGLTAIGGKAYLLVDDVLQVWNVEDPTAPVLAGTVPLAHRQTVLSIDGTRLYLLQRREGKYDEIVTFDLSQPAQPKMIGSTPLDIAIPHQAMAYYDRIYCLYDGSVQVFDLSDPARVVPLQTLSLPTDIKSQISTDGSSVYIGTHSGLWILDASNKAILTEAGRYTNLPVDLMGIVASKGYLINSICEGGESEDGSISYGCGITVDVLDLSDPTQPRSIGYARLHLASTNDGYIEQARFLGEYAYLRTSTGLWYMLDLRGLQD